MSITLEKIVDDVGELVSLPEVCIRVNELVDDPDSSTNEIGQVISQDPALTLRILKIANSPFYGASSQIETVSKAVAILGMKQIRDLVLATSATSVFAGLPNELVSMKDFWRHSIFCAICARILSEEHKKGKGEALFISGLLHDIGQLAIFNKAPEQARQAIILSMEGSDESDLYGHEVKIMGFDHTQVGGELVRKWKLPESIYECVRFHHEPLKAEKYPVETAMIHIANSIAVMAELDTIQESAAPAMEPVAWEIAGLSKDVIEPVMLGARDQIAEVEALLSS